MIDFNPIKPNDTVFLGDSLTESFDLVKHFGRSDIRNRGMSGNTTAHVLYRLEEISNTKPVKLFLMIGVNDFFQGSSTSDIFEQIKKILAILQGSCPDTQVFVQSVLPVNVSRLFTDKDMNVDIYKLNDLLSGLCQSTEQLSYINLHTEFLGMDGEMDTRYTADGVHLNDEGYKLWARLVEAYL